jgi:ABC-type Fe3+-siderophore transport system permease subunit
MATVNAMYTAMFDASSFQWTHTIHQPVISDLARQWGITLSPMMKLLPVLIFLQCWVWLMPNLQQLMRGQEYATTTLGIPPSRLQWRANMGWGLLTVLALAFSFMAVYQTGEFIYFQF